MNSQLWSATHTGLVRASHSFNISRTWYARFLCYAVLLCAGLMVVNAQAAFQAVETFDTLNLADIDGQNGWDASAGSGEVVQDPSGGGNQVLKVSTESGDLQKAVSVAQGATRMLFVRLRFEEHGRYSFGLSFASNPTEYVDFSSELGMAAATTGDPGNELRVANGLGTEIYDVLTNLVPGIWYNIWVLVNNDSETYEVWLNSTPGEDATGGDQLSNSEAETLFGFRTAAATDLKNFFIKTGGGNSPLDGRFYIDDIYLENTGSTNLSNPTDGSESVSKDDIAVDFGAATGFWARMNDASWLKLHPTLSPDLVALANMDGNGEDDVIADFSSTIGGIYVKYNLGSWSKLHPGNSESLTGGDLDGNGQDDLVVDFSAATGFWARMNDVNWLKLHPTLSPDLVAVGDMDGNGQDDVIADFSSTIGGIYVKRNLGTWSKLHPGSSESLTTGDLDGNGQDDVLVDFGAATGFWARMNDATWLRLHPTLSPDVVATGDVDGNGADDVLAGFGDTVGGLWSKLNLGGWTQQNPNSPDDVVAADMTGNGEDDIVADFGSTVGGIWVKRDQGVWAKLHPESSESLTAGELD